MSRRIEHDGTVFRRKGTKFWWMRYRERDGSRRRESTFTDDWQEAQKKLRERLQARDGNILQIVRQGESLLFGKWTEFFMENYSKPPSRFQDPKWCGRATVDGSRQPSVSEPDASRGTGRISVS